MTFGHILRQAVWTLSVCSFTGTLGSSAAAADGATNWTLAFKSNDRLPAGFREFRFPRPDGSTQIGFLAESAQPSEAKRPLLVFVDGSGAHSQFFFANGQRGWGVFGALARKAADRFVVATSEKRGVTFGETGHGAATQASREYAHHATFEDRVAETRRLLDVMLTQPIVDRSRVVLLGHSEGADVAAGVAAEDPRVTHVAFLSGGGPTQIFDLIVLRRKAMAAAGATPEQIEQAVQELEADFRRIFADRDNEEKLFMGHAYRRWASFCSHPPVEALLRTKARLFLAHGSADDSVPIEAFDLLCAELIRAGRTDVDIRRYAGRGHSLAPPGAARGGPPLADLFDDILNWALGKSASTEDCSKSGAR